MILEQIDPIRLLTTTTELRRTIEQLNVQFIAIQDNNNILSNEINNNILTILKSADVILNSALTVEVNSDSDILYTDDGEILSE